MQPWDAVQGKVQVSPWSSDTRVHFRLHDPSQNPAWSTDQCLPPTLQGGALWPLVPNDVGVSVICWGHEVIPVGYYDYQMSCCLQGYVCKVWLDHCDKAY